MYNTARSKSWAEGESSKVGNNHTGGFDHGEHGKDDVMGNVVM